MITKKLLEYVKRQTLLSAKIADGTATAEERTEFAKINAAIKAATEPQEMEQKTLVTTMRLDEFQKHVEAEMGALEASPDPERAALLRRNIANVKAQGKTQAEDIVGVEVMKTKSADDRIAVLEAQVADLSAKLQAAEASKGDDDGEGDGDSGEGDGGESGDEGEGDGDGADDGDKGDDGEGDAGDQSEGDSGDDKDGDDAGDDKDGDAGDAGDAEDEDMGKDAGWASDLAPAAAGGNDDYSLLKRRPIKDADA